MNWYIGKMETKGRKNIVLVFFTGQLILSCNWYSLHEVPSTQLS